ncbi:MAG TPA: GTP cyclohydrolase I FolE [Anaerolineaceae bacterium]|jgi:GTP cyclohydrolase I|nr:GTP cyclohydrolase I FolE [Anaerolineaceae bacterium]HOR84458.1 GTP cyclohydrolase I FolE [Anaerolineaceae bacterium]HPL43043.1 GTP cyclohydrolase I FolE [Anaerolineaceae bacterium]HPY32950.1 GTP cyclohydrolase I FolE [Anaerolineaceae bacterium]HQC20504.1 GTP cyclohydrolase I FolE [Anaerolineaceae bacterium]
MDCDKPIFRAADLFCETEMDFDKIQRSTTKILEAIGENPEREGLLKTPSRVAKAYAEILAGYRMNPEELINNALFSVDYDEMVIVKGIEFYSMCEHHMLPFYGVAHVAYIPSGKVIGLSKIPRIVEMYSRRLQVQERMTLQIADFIQEVLKPKGVAVVVEGKHLCMMMRGVKKQEASMTTSHMLGVFREQLPTRMEFLNRISAELTF